MSDIVYGACPTCGANMVSCGARVGRCRTLGPDEPDDRELCVSPGCSAPSAPRLPCCPAHWALVPAPEQVGYLEAADQALTAPDVPRARRAARSRVGAVLRGVRA